MGELVYLFAKKTPAAEIMPTVPNAPIAPPFIPQVSIDDFVIGIVDNFYDWALLSMVVAKPIVNPPQNKGLAPPKRLSAPARPAHSASVEALRPATGWRTGMHSRL